MTKRIAVETLSLSEISDLFQKSIEIAFPKSKGAIAHKLKRLKKLGISSSKWIKTYEDASLKYIGINKHEDEEVGLYDTVLSSDDYIELVENE